MTKDEVVQVAEEYLKREDIRYVECFSQTLIPEDRLHLWCGEKGILKGDREKVWMLCYEIEELPAGVVSTGNNFLVLVDDDTKECGVFWGM